MLDLSVHGVLLLYAEATFCRFVLSLFFGYFSCLCSRCLCFAEADLRLNFSLYCGCGLMAVKVSAAVHI